MSILMFTLPLISNNRILYMIYIISIGIFGMGYLVFTGPALNYYFGLENA